MKPSLENLLGRSFDTLIEHCGPQASFAQEAKMVAAFTRLYIQNLFKLSHNEFNTLMKKHRELHSQAERAEQRGIPPLTILRKHVEKGDQFGTILNKYTAHLGALDCILDVKATAALVHHILRFVPVDGLPRAVTGCEMGAGTGILTFAGLVPFLAGGKRIIVQSFEQSPVSIHDATSIANILKTESKYGDFFHVTFQLGDITDEPPYKKIVDTAADEGPLALWISETFGYRSKKPVVEGDSIICFEEPDGTAEYSAMEEKAYDPLPLVIDLSCRYFQGFLEKIGNGSLSAFPDIVTPKVIIDGKNSAILAADGKWRDLSEIGTPYTMLPPCVPSRWNFTTAKPQSSEDGARKKIAKRKRKRKYYTI